jgi:hypothetical protein
MKHGNKMQRLRLAVALSSLGMLSACPRPVFDPRLELASSGWSSKIGAFITSAEERAGTPEGAYEANKLFYADIQASIAGHVERIRGGSNNPRILDILKDLSNSVEKLRTLHESNGKDGLPEAVAEPARQIIASELRSLERLQAEYKSAAQAKNQ